MKTEFLLVERDRANEALSRTNESLRGANESLRRTNDALIASEQRYKRLLTATTDYIYTVNLDHGVTRGTSHGPGCEAVTGYSPADFENHPYLWYQIIHEDDRPAVLAQVDRILRGELPPPLEHRIIRRDGSVGWIRNTTIPHHDGSNGLVAYDGLITDITERKRADAELQETQRQLLQAARFESIGTLAAGVAHEVKNPLQTILMGVHYLSRKLDACNEELALTLADMRESVTRANAIIGDLLSISKVTRFQTESQDLNRVLQHCLRLIRSQMDAAQVAVVLNLDRDLPSAKLDESRMEQVFLNLFINSIQAMPSGGTLSVTTRTVTLDQNSAEIAPLFRKFPPGQRVLLAEIRDTGTGIKEADLLRLFDPFFTTKPVGIGTGLGLYMARMIIDLHGGVIDIKNAPPRGVLATIALNAQEEDGLCHGHAS